MFHFETNPRKNTHTHLHPHDSQRQRFPAESRKRRYNGHVTDEKTKTKHTERKKKRKEKKEKKNREREPDPKRKNLPGNAPIRVHALTARQTRSGRKDTHDRNIPKCIGPRPEDVRRRPRARSRKCAHTRTHAHSSGGPDPGHDVTFTPCVAHSPTSHRPSYTPRKGSRITNGTIVAYAPFRRGRRQRALAPAPRSVFTSNVSPFSSAPTSERSHRESPPFRQPNSVGHDLANTTSPGSSQFLNSRSAEDLGLVPFRLGERNDQQMPK